MTLIGWAPARCIAGLLVLLGLTACATTTIQSEIEPEIIAVGPYQYPYQGLKLEVDPKGYTEYIFGIETVDGIDAHLAVKDENWTGVRRQLTLEFTPAAHRDWMLHIVFKHPDGKTIGLSKGFSVGLPPWHAESAAFEFGVKVEYSCPWSEYLPHMGPVKTLVGYKLDIVDLPPDLDRSTFVGFSASAPRIKHAVGGPEQIVAGVGSGRVDTFEGSLRFAGNYQLAGSPYPRCRDLKNIEVVDWDQAAIRLIDKYQFPLGSSVGRVRSLVRGASWYQRPPAAGVLPGVAKKPPQ